MYMIYISLSTVRHTDPRLLCVIVGEPCAATNEVGLLFGCPSHCQGHQNYSRPTRYIILVLIIYIFLNLIVILSLHLFIYQSIALFIIAKHKKIVSLLSSEHTMVSSLCHFTQCFNSISFAI